MGEKTIDDSNYHWLFRNFREGDTSYQVQSRCRYSSLVIEAALNQMMKRLKKTHLNVLEFLDFSVAFEQKVEWFSSASNEYLYNSLSM